MEINFSLSADKQLHLVCQLENARPSQDALELNNLSASGVFTIIFQPILDNLLQE